MKDSLHFLWHRYKQPVIEARDADTLYAVSLSLKKQNMDQSFVTTLKLDNPAARYDRVDCVVNKVRNLSKKTKDRSCLVNM